MAEPKFEKDLERLEQTVEALGLVGDAPEEQARMSAEDTRA